MYSPLQLGLEGLYTPKYVPFCIVIYLRTEDMYLPKHAHLCVVLYLSIEGLYSLNMYLCV